MNSKTLALSLSAAAFLISCKQQSQPVKASDGTTKIQAVHSLWHCAMHPQIIRDHPGNCPICGMELVPFQQEGAATPDTAMQPGATASSHASHDIVIDPNVVQKIGVRTDIVQAGVVGPELRVDAEGVLDEVSKLSVTVRTPILRRTDGSTRTALPAGVFASSCFSIASFGAAATEAASLVSKGTSSIPQMGQWPSWSLTIWGCMGQCHAFLTAKVVLGDSCRSGDLQPLASSAIPRVAIKMGVFIGFHPWTWWFGRRPA